MNLRMSCAQLAQPISAAQAGKGTAADPADQRAFLERPVDDDGDAALARQRQDALLDFAVDRVVGDLNEIERLAAHDLLELAVAAAFGSRDADIADLAGGFHGVQRLQMLAPRQQIVDLHQVETRRRPIAGATSRSVRRRARRR